MQFSSVIIIVTAVMASLLEIIDTSIVNVAVPTMMGNLGATLENISWVITGYVLANAIVLPIAGWLGMQIGRRVYYTGCILLFTATSVGCGFAPNLEVLIFFRVIQGLAGGALLPTSQALIQEAFPREKAGMASAIYGMSIMIGPTLGPTLGGYLTDNFGWRSIFNVNLPLGLLAAALSYLYVKDFKARPLADGSPAPARQRTPIDVIGLILLVVGIGCLQYVLERGEADDWFDSTSILISTLAAALAIPGFVWWELRTPHPIVDVRLFKVPVVRYGALLMMEVGNILYSIIFLVPVFSSVVLGLTATQTGELFIPGALLAALAMPFIGMLLRKTDPRGLIFCGIVILEIALVLFTGFTPQTTSDTMFMPLLIRGFGMSFLFVPINTVVLSQFSGPQLGQVAGILNLFRQLGGSIGIATASVLLKIYQAQFFSEISGKIGWLNPLTAHQLQAMRAGMSHRMSTVMGFASPESAMIRMLGFRIQKQVFVLSFGKLMWIVFFVFMLALLPLVFLKPKKKITGPVDAH